MIYGKSFLLIACNSDDLFLLPLPIFGGMVLSDL